MNITHSINLTWKELSGISYDMESKNAIAKRKFISAKRRLMLTPSSDSLIASLRKPEKSTIDSSKSVLASQSHKERALSSMRKTWNSPQRGKEAYSVKEERRILSATEQLHERSFSVVASRRNRNLSSCCSFIKSEQQSLGNRHETSRSFQHQTVERQQPSRLLSRSYNLSERKPFLRTMSASHSEPIGFGCLPDGWPTLTDDKAFDTKSKCLSFSDPSLNTEINTFSVKHRG